MILFIVRIAENEKIKKIFAFNVDIFIHGIFGKKYFSLHAVCDILTPKSIVCRFKKARSFQPAGRAAFTLRVNKKYQKRSDRDVTGNQEGSRTSREMKRSLNGRILRHTTLNILMLVVVCCVIMALSMQSLAKSILLDSLQPMARQSAKTMEANIHMLADRMMTIAAIPG